MTKQKNIPQIRFKGFSEEWVEKRVGDDAQIGDGLHGTPEYADNGEYYFINGNNLFKGEIQISEETKKVEKKSLSQSDLSLETNTILLSINGTIGNLAWYRGEKVMLGKSVAYITNYNIENVFLYHVLQTRSVQKFFLNNLTGSTIKNLGLKTIRDALINCPSSPIEQTRIGAFFQSLDKLLTLHQQQYTKLTNLKKAMLEKMFPRPGADTPEIRFKGFTGKWNKIELNELCSIITKQTGFDYSAKIKPSLLSYYSDDCYSFIQNKDFHTTEINLHTDFYIPKKVADQFPNIVLDRASILITISGKIGNVGFYNKPQNAFIGGAVGICKLLNAGNGLFIIYQLQSNRKQRYFDSLIKASSHSNITVEDIRKIELLIPKSDSEKLKIGTYFQNLDRMIAQHQTQLTKLQNIKKACLEKMFV